MTKEISALDQALIEAIGKVSNVTGEVYDGATKVTGNAIDFATAQIPDVVEQLLRWALIEAAVGLVVSGLAIWVCYYCVKRFWKASEGIVVLPVMFIVAGSAMIFVVALLDALKIIFAPKLFLIEYAAGLLK